MKATELIQLFEYGKAFGKRPDESRKYKKEKKEMTLKAFIQFQKDLEAYEAWRKEMADREKKEQKAKEHKKEGISSAHMAMFLVATFPITAPVYVYAMKMLLDSMK